MSRLFAVLLSLFFMHAPGRALAWFDMGHMTVAAVGYSKLDPAVRVKIANLLRLNPDYETWVAGTPVEHQDMVAFVRASTWADDIKKRHDYHGGSLSEDGAHANDNIGYDDYLVHPYWHYIDLPFSPDGTPTVQPVAPNALTQIKTFRDTLSSNVPDQVKSYDLVWLLHLVGDAHQPLHATSRFTHGLPKGDNGGNLEFLCRAFTCGLKLHAFWDALLGDSGRPDDAIVIAAALPPADPALVSVSDPSAWFQEGADLAKQFVYTTAIKDGAGPFTLDAQYQQTATRIARQRVSLAGERLANLLNAALK
jgi:hypothetical protein